MLESGEATTYKLVQVAASVFRAYDIRGEVASVLGPDVVYTLGRAIGSEARARGEHAIIVARDGRLSGSSLLAALVAALRASGLAVLDVGMVPTPVLYYATHHLGCASGVMLTGSHNPAGDNGLKIVLAGHTLSGDDIQALRLRIDQADLAQGSGAYKRHDGLLDQYQCEVTKRCQLARPLKVVVDCGHGVTGVIAAPLLRALGAEVVALYTEVDGHFPRHHPDPTRPENLQDLIRVVQAQGADVGIAFDGDGDRLGVVRANGEIIWADRLMMLFAREICLRNPGAQIIYDVKCTQHLARVIEAAGGVPLMTQTGHSLVKAKLLETGALLAGEMSGHIFFKDGWYGFDDALYAAGRLLQLLASQDASADAQLAALPNSVNTPELHVAMPDERKHAFVRELAAKADFGDAEVVSIDGLRVHFSRGWGLVRASNTTPCLVLRFEADDEQALANVQACFRTQLLALDAGLALPF